MFKVVAKLKDLKPESLTEASFFEANTVKHILTKIVEGVEPKVMDVVDKMSIYLENSTTQSILLKPVSKKISKGLEEIKKSAIGMSDENNGWDESTREEVVGTINDLEKAVKKLG